MLKIVDIFYSIQGEGNFSGVPCIFVRLHGCNLDCSFCDEDLHKGAYESKTIDEILEHISQHPSKYVVITGGEPSLNDINEFIDALHVKDYHVAIESNGYKFEHIKNADWITYSPKDWDSLHVEGFNEYKFIVGADSDINKLLHVNQEKPIYIQPENFKDRVNKENADYCIELVKKHPQFKLSVQLHKYLGVE
ncbi:7-carboxy-7-deazaguanine synthase QueE [Sulfurospirillum arcachonense]|uniref:7-carboxy-7-deazaguanine synthase QueE n=1 Tax=Sulfurospirillum arcachonense TaxID=57666 RepID=UPI0004685699|nr:7-carboxy-7-deazaguanine synthase QueE [Sulfurospirillum arcachonense]